MSYIDQALELLDQGFAVVPIHPKTKHPPMPWGHYVDSNTPPTEEKVEELFTEYPDANVGIITGPLSGVVVVDCDTPEARDYAEEIGLTNTPVRVKTKKGWHFYFRYPENGDVKSAVGANSNHVDWPGMKGLDLRGRKGIAVAPPTEGYSWDFKEGGYDFDDMPEYKPPTYPFPGPPPGHEATPKVREKATAQVLPFTGFAGQDLSLVGNVSVWAETAAIVEESGKLPTGAGNGRDARLYRYMGEEVAKGTRGDDLIASACEFMQEFYMEAIDLKKVQSMADRLEQAEAQNHPERKVEARPEPEQAPQPEPEGEVALAPPFEPITTKDIDRLKAELGSVEYFIEPWLPTYGSIIQIHGYSGHGKSKFARAILYAAAAGQSDRWGPFILGRRPKVFYLDYENSKANVQAFLEKAKKSYGDAGDNFEIWAPFADKNTDLNLKTDEGLKKFESYVNYIKPDVVVIDTIRSAFPGMEENNAQEWARVNKLTLAIRNAGASCILLHHSNKPNDSGFGREAGSSNQLTTLETQMRVTQVFQDQETARNNGGIYDGDSDNPIWPTLNTYPAISLDESCYMINEIRYGKVREWTEAHQRTQHVAWVHNRQTQAERIHSQRSPKQRAILMAKGGMNGAGQPMRPKSDEDIADLIRQPIEVVRQWTKDVRDEIQSPAQSSG